MNIILIHQDEIQNHIFSFSKNDARFQHIQKVLKLSEKAQFKAGIINGKKGLARITCFSAEMLTARFETYDAPLPPPEVKLILGFPRPIQLRRIIRDITCLGIDSLYLTGTALGEKSYLSADIATDEALYRLLLDGCAQAGQTYVPAVYKAHSVRQLLSVYGVSMQIAGAKALVDLYTPFYASQVCSSPQQNAFEPSHTPPRFAPLTALPWQQGTPLWLAIGSERGWTDEERVLFLENGFAPYGMGSRILRTETAAAAALAVSLAQAGYWEL
ncbi:MAG: RsmE family RNA methyltransferase [Treponema sp.]